MKVIIRLAHHGVDLTELYNITLVLVSETAKVHVSA